eukprot:GHVQ01015755.1.p1 GENE.GHVQ01015755.1~~GHVQ01015755.1.p1  ORF type:complete len:342 (+),score=62.82 GHVQ01015755.1:172-1197(+)
MTMTSSTSHSITIMSYNVLQYSDSRTTNERADNIHNIIKSENPEVLGIQELTNIDGLKKLQQSLSSTTSSTTSSTSSSISSEYNITENCLCMDGQKDVAILWRRGGHYEDVPVVVEYIDTYQLNPNNTDECDILRVTLRERYAPNRHVHFFVVHLKAGSAHEGARAHEAQNLMKYMYDKLLLKEGDGGRDGGGGGGDDEEELIVIMGDYNIYSSDEEGYKILMKLFVDPLVKQQLDVHDHDISKWTGNKKEYAWMYTQSTTKDRNQEKLPGGSHGGLDDRFDMILVSRRMYELMRGKEEIIYKVVGNTFDNARFNETVEHIDHLKFCEASDHLPVVITYTV